MRKFKVWIMFLSFASLVILTSSVAQAASPGETKDLKTPYAEKKMVEPKGENPCASKDVNKPMAKNPCAGQKMPAKKVLPSKAWWEFWK
jgi:hypothetical protein